MERSEGFNDDMKYIKPRVLREAPSLRIYSC